MIRGRRPVLMFVLLAAVAAPHTSRAQVGTGASAGNQPEVDAAWQTFSAQWNGARQVDARAAGAKGDGQVATDCTIDGASPALTCASAHFQPDDAGKAIAVYGAGAAWNGTARPLTSTIARVVSASSIVLADAASARAQPSPRVVWGTDDTASLQSAIDTLASRTGSDGPGGVLRIPAGHFLTRGLSLPCARRGTFPQGRCTATYNHIWITGAGRDATTIENWDIETPLSGVVTLGRLGDAPVADSPNARLRTLAISDLTVRQVAYATRPASAIWAFATEDVWLMRTAGVSYSYECYVMGGGVKSVRWRVHDNQLGPCGHGGPAYPNGTSALNLNGADWIASHNTVTDSLQAVEMGSRRGTLIDNVFIAPQRNAIGVNVGSTGTGIWENTIARNQITGFISAIEVFNSLGTVNRTSIIDNTIVDGVVSVNSGMERNSVLEGDADTVVHGTSIVRGNTLTYTTYLGNTPIKIGTAAYGPQAGLETVAVTGNTVTYTSMYLQGGTEAGQPCVADRAGGTCRLSGGFIGLSAYGGTEDREGPKPMVTATDNVLRGPAGAVSGGSDVAIRGSRRGALVLERLDANFAWQTLEQPGP